MYTALKKSYDFIVNNLQKTKKRQLTIVYMDTFRNDL